MKKWMLFVLTLVFLFAMAGCNKGTDTMYRLGIMVDGIFYEKSHAMPAEIEESAVIGYVAFYTDAFPTREKETNISKDLIGAPVARVEDGIAILYQNEWYLCKADATEEKDKLIYGTPHDTNGENGAYAPLGYVKDPDKKSIF